MAVAAARVDRRSWVRAIAGLQVLALAAFTWGYFVLAKLPEAGVETLGHAPDFTLVGADGRSISLGEELGAGPVLLVFFRGHW